MNTEADCEGFKTEIQLTTIPISSLGGRDQQGSVFGSGCVSKVPSHINAFPYILVLFCNSVLIIWVHTRRQRLSAVREENPNKERKEEEEEEERSSAPSSNSKNTAQIHTVKTVTFKKHLLKHEDSNQADSQEQRHRPRVFSRPSPLSARWLVELRGSSPLPKHIAGGPALPKRGRDRFYDPYRRIA